MATSKTANHLFWSMITSAHKKGNGSPDMLKRTLIGIDPGETTGIGHSWFWETGFKVHMQQLKTQDRIAGGINIKNYIQDVLEGDKGREAPPPLIICEDYRVYGHKAESHSWAGLHTPKLIGHIERVAYELQIPVVFPMAIEGKQWATDENLKMWDLYEAGERHARDASRHIVTRAFFGKDPL